jgi:hypothetical protein
VVESIPNRITVMAQVLVRGVPNPVFVEGCGRRALERQTSPSLGWLNYGLPTYATSPVHGGFSRKG